MTDASPTTESVAAAVDRAADRGELLALLMLFTGPVLVFATAFLLAR